MRIRSNPVEEHEEVPTADEGRWEDMIASWSRHQRSEPPATPGQNSCYVVSVGTERSELRAKAQLAEILGLVEARGDRVVGQELRTQARPVPRSFLGTGVCAEVAEAAVQSGADMLVLDAALSPSQTRNLEELTGFAVCDREAVILAVFAKHARSRKARIQVEIANLQYLRPRIRGIGLDMDQQAGGIMGGKGSGETASELLARRLDGRLAKLRKAFEGIRRAGAQQRQRRRDSCRRIALVGYTNAGKSTLMNGLTHAEVSTRDRPFETLDTTSRALTRHGGDVLIGDTVGFIRNLPASLLDSFESTLAEISEADLLVIVLDASDPEWELHLQTTTEVLTRLEADEIDRCYVFNKIDKASAPPRPQQLKQACAEAPHFLLSALAPEAVAELREQLITLARRDHHTARLLVPYAAAEVIASIYSRCRVHDAATEDEGLRMHFSAPAHVVSQIRHALAEVTA